MIMVLSDDLAPSEPHDVANPRPNRERAQPVEKSAPYKHPDAAYWITFDIISNGRDGI